MQDEVDAIKVIQDAGYDPHLFMPMVIACRKKIGGSLKTCAEMLTEVANIFGGVKGS